MDKDLVEKIITLEKENAQLKDELNKNVYELGFKLDFKHLVEILPIPLCCSTFDGKFVFINKKFTNLFGFTLTEIEDWDTWILKTMSCKDLAYDLKEFWEKDLDKINEKKRAQIVKQECSINSATGEILNIEIISFAENDLIYSLFNDITHRKEYELEIQKLLTAVVQSPASIVITDLHGNIEYVNPKFCEITGYTADEALGKNPRILKSGNLKPEVYTSLWEKISRGGTWKGEFLNKKKNGEDYWEFAIISPIVDDNGSIVKYIAVKEDVTIRKEIESNLVASEKKFKELNATKDKFFSIIGHDLKNPFANILTLSELIISEKHEMDKERIFKICELIYLSSKTGFDLLVNLLEWARAQTGRIVFTPVKVHVGSLVNEIETLLMHNLSYKKIKLNKCFDSTHSINADRNMLLTILRNLVSNAIKYSFENSIISLDLKKEKNQYVFSVTDTGIGISKTAISRLFKIDEQFSTSGTSNETGTGLGLILCKEFVTAHKGNIWVESEVGNGTTFSFSIPRNVM